MLYPIYVHVGDARYAHGVTIPDFPGCFSAADSWNNLPAKVQEAVEVYCDGEDMEIPAPSSLDDLMRSPDYAGGIWMVMDIDTSRLDTKAERINITLPARLLRVIDQYVESTNGNRSAFLVEAAMRQVRAATTAPKRAAGKSTVKKKGAKTADLGRASKKYVTKKVNQASTVKNVRAAVRRKVSN